jgi:hypothetical protein
MAENGIDIFNTPKMIMFGFWDIFTMKKGIFGEERDDAPLFRQAVSHPQLVERITSVRR